MARIAQILREYTCIRAQKALSKFEVGIQNVRVMKLGVTKFKKSGVKKLGINALGVKTFEKLGIKTWGVTKLGFGNSEFGSEDIESYEIGS